MAVGKFPWALLGSITFPDILSFDYKNSLLYNVFFVIRQPFEYLNNIEVCLLRLRASHCTIGQNAILTNVDCFVTLTAQRGA
jgi:hypothetical protein